MQICICIIGIISSMKPTSRLRILNHIHKHQAASVKEISSAMGMTGANVRHHLASLELDDLVAVVSLRKEGPGRPTQIYGLSRRMMGDGMSNLAGKILDTWQGGKNKESREADLKSLANALGGETGVNMPIMMRLTKAISVLNELHYMAGWEARATGPSIILGHCPYAAIIGDHPELCRMDAMLIQNKLGATVMQSVKMQINDKGLPYCAFQMVGN